MNGAAIGIAQLVNNITSGQTRIMDRNADLRKTRTVKDAIRAIGQLQAENAELRLYLATVICILISNKIVSPEEFEKLSTLIDSMDGVADGQFDGQIGTDGTVGAGAKARENLPLRELAATLKKMGR
ncbi:MAG: hypothetical protein GY794_16625 [bacterium]|nr:hypothetical protein [bacterium]